MWPHLTLFIILEEAMLLHSNSGENNDKAVDFWALCWKNITIKQRKLRRTLTLVLHLLLLVQLSGNGIMCQVEFLHGSLRRHLRAVKRWKKSCASG